MGNYKIRIGREGEDIVTYSTTYNGRRIKTERVPEKEDLLLGKLCEKGRGLLRENSQVNRLEIIFSGEKPIN